VAGRLSRDLLEAAVDHLPMGVLLLSPGAEPVVTFANRAAHGMAGGEFPLGSPVTRHERYTYTDPAGRPIPRDEMPSVRAAAGERLGVLLAEMLNAGDGRSAAGGGVRPSAVVVAHER
jgi:hypothetical protein